MRKPAQVAGWLSDLELLEWVRESPDVGSYQKRLAIWLTVMGPFHARPGGFDAWRFHPVGLALAESI
jgi:hypothetical protein